MTLALTPSVAANFSEFHAANPEVYGELESLALQQLQAGRTHIGLRMLWETMRFNFGLRTVSKDYKLNNNHLTFYARMLIEKQPALRGVIELRRARHATNELVGSQ